MAVEVVMQTARYTQQQQMQQGQQGQQEQSYSNYSNQQQSYSYPSQNQNNNRSGGNRYSNYWLLQCGVSEAEKVDDVEKIVAKNAALDWTGEVVNRSIDQACNERQREKIEVFDEGEMQPGEEERNHNNAKRSRPFCMKVVVNFSLEEASKKGFFWDCDKKEVGNEKNEPAVREL